MSCQHIFAGHGPCRLISTRRASWQYRSTAAASCLSESVTTLRMLELSSRKCQGSPHCTAFTIDLSRWNRFLWVLLVCAFVCFRGNGIPTVGQVSACARESIWKSAMIRPSRKKGSETDHASSLDSLQMILHVCCLFAGR